MQYSGSKKICESIPHAGLRKSLVRSVGWTTHCASCSIRANGSSRCRVGVPGALEDRTTDLPRLRAPYVSAWGSRVHSLRSRYAAQPSALVLVFSNGLRTSRSAVRDAAARVAATCRRSSLRAALPPHRSRLAYTPETIGGGAPSPRKRPFKAVRLRSMLRSRFHGASGVMSRTG